MVWAFEDGATEHNVRFDDATLGGSDLQSSGEFSVGLPERGTFRFHCTVHQGMVGEIVVD